MIFFALAQRQNEIEKRQREGEARERDRAIRELQALKKSGIEVPSEVFQAISGEPDKELR